MSRSFTFHMQIREDIQSQNRAEDFRAFLSRPDAIEALDHSRMIHFARTVLIPNRRVTPGTLGTFAVQVVVVYDGKYNAFIDWLAGTNPIRELFVGISEIAKRPCTDMLRIEDWLRANNLSRTSREMHKGHRHSLAEIQAAFPGQESHSQGKQGGFLPRQKPKSDVA